MVATNDNMIFSHDHLRDVNNCLFRAAVTALGHLDSVRRLSTKEDISRQVESNTHLSEAARKVRSLVASQEPLPHGAMPCRRHLEALCQMFNVCAHVRHMCGASERTVIIGDESSPSCLRLNLFNEHYSVDVHSLAVPFVRGDCGCALFGGATPEEKAIQKIEKAYRNGDTELEVRS